MTLPATQNRDVWDEITFPYLSNAIVHELRLEDVAAARIWLFKHKQLATLTDARRLAFARYLFVSRRIAS